MSTFDLVESSDPRPSPKWLPAIGGLLAAGMVAFVVCRLPALDTLSWGQLVNSAVESVLAVFAASAVTVRVLYAIQTGTSALVARSLMLGTSLGALWLAPLTLFIRENSTWTIAIAAVLVVTVTKSLRLLQDRSERDLTEEPPDLFLGPNTLSPTESLPWFWQQLTAAGAALCAQTSAVAGFTGYPLTAATLLGISSAVWTWSFTRDAVPDSRQFSAPSQSMPRVLLALAMAIVFTVGALIRFLPNTVRSAGLGASSRHASRHILTQEDSRRGQPGGEKGSQGAEQRWPAVAAKAYEGSIAAARDGNSGVILWPKEPTNTKLVAPAPAMANGLLKSSRSAKPLIIPFNGVYWFFKAPDLQPPVTSREAHGSPELLDIHSTDRRPLSMEAHEHFGSMIDLDCCSRIQLAIRNADVYSETVSMELVLINSSLPGKPSQSLGTIMVKSPRSRKLRDKPSPTGETLSFPIPTNHSLRRFDEVMIRFGLATFRADDGAKIAIDHFVLVPRGR